MSKQLYEEALLEVKQLKALAEDNAKKAVLDEVTPKIKQLIEQQLDSLHSLPSTPAVSKPALEISQQAFDVARQVVVEGATPADIVRSVDKLCSHMHANKKSSTLVEAAKAVAVMVQESNMSNFTKSLIHKRLERSLRTTSPTALREAALNIKIDGFGEDDLDEDTLNNLKIEIVPDVEEPGEGEEMPAPDAEGEAGPPPDEMPPPDAEAGPPEGEEAPAQDVGGEEPPPEEAPEEPVKKEGKNMDKFAMLSDDTVVEIDEGMLRQEIARMKALREAKEKMPKASKNAPKVKPGAAAKMAHHFGGGAASGDAMDQDLRDLEESLMAGLKRAGKYELAENDDLDEMYEMHDLDEGDDDDKKSSDAMRNLATAGGAAVGSALGGAAGAGLGALGGGMAADAFGGKKKEEKEENTDESYGVDENDDVIEIVDEGDEEGQGGAGDLDEDDFDEARDRPEYGGSDRSDSRKRGRSPGMDESRRYAALIEARKKSAKLANKAKDVAEKAKKNGDKKVFDKAKKVFKESVQRYAQINAALSAMAGSSQRSNSAASEVNDLRNQLAETNLFNAKLLYTNKLLQNEALSPRQKVAIIEKLDEARSLREAKLVYESLIRTIASGKTNVNEGVGRQVLGSASRATRPSSTVSLNEGVETARWARLAGITK